jgi:hypothetical protein
MAQLMRMLLAQEAMLLTQEAMHCAELQHAACHMWQPAWPGYNTTKIAADAHAVVCRLCGCK